MTRVAYDSIAKDQFKVNVFHAKHIDEIADSDDLYDAFESGWPVVIKGLTIPKIDYDYYDDLEDWVIKGNKWIAPWYPSAIRKGDRLRDERGWSDEQIEEFREQHKRSNSGWHQFFDTLFPRYAEAKDKVLSHRYNMLVENMLHLDELTEMHTGMEQQIRMFVQLDKKRSRVLTFGPDLVQLYHQYKEEFGLEKFDKDNTHEFITNMRNATIWNEQQWAHFHHPLHYITFDPGDIWMFNAQWISHQIIFGAKLQCFEADIPQELLKNPEMCMRNRILNLENEKPYGFNDDQLS